MNENNEIISNKSIETFSNLTTVANTDEVSVATTNTITDSSNLLENIISNENISSETIFNNSNDNDASSIFPASNAPSFVNTDESTSSSNSFTSSNGKTSNFSNGKVEIARKIVGNIMQKAVNKLSKLKVKS